MKKIIIFAVLMFIIVTVSSAQFRVIEKPKEVTNHVGFVNLPDEDRYDINGELCGMLIVRTGIEEMNIDSPLRHRLIPKEGEYWVVLQPGAWYVDLKKKDYVTEMVNLRESIGKIESGKVYEMAVDGDGGIAEVPVVITCNQSGADVYIDGESKGKIENKILAVSVPTGKREIKIMKEGFSTQFISELITLKNNTFSFKLLPAMPAVVKITSEPEGAEVYLEENIKLGTTPLEKLYDEGIYPIKIVKQNYETIIEEINITEAGAVKHYILEDIRAKLTIRTNPDAKVIFDGKEYKGGIENLILLPRNINFVIEEKYCETIDIEYTLQKGENKIFELYPEDISATLSIITSPNAIVYFQDETYQGGFSGMKLMPQQINFKIEQDLCEPIEDSYTLREKETKVIELYPEDISATLTVLTHPKAVVTFNGKSFTGGVKNHKMYPQALEILVEMKKAESLSKMITLKPGSTETLELYPEQNCGVIQVICIPTDSQIELTGDDGEFFNAVGKQIFDNIPIGEYKLRISKQDYITHEEKINLETGGVVTKSIDLEKANYIFKFKTQGYGYIEDLDFVIKRNGKIVYYNKGKSEINFSEAGEYEISITKGEHFGFSKNMKVLESKVYTINVINHEQQKKEKEQKKNRDFANRIYGSQNIKDNKIENIESVAQLFLNLNSYNKDYVLSCILVNSKESLQCPLLGKEREIDLRSIENANYSFFYGVSLLGNCIFSSEMTLLDILSLNGGIIFSSNDHKNRLLIDIDAGGKWAFGYNLQNSNKELTFVESISICNNELIVNKMTFGGWVPADVSLNLERYIGWKSFIILKVGILFTTDMGHYTDGQWYYKEDIENWSSNDSLPKPLAEEPEHPIYQGIVPYFGLGIRF